VKNGTGWTGLVRLLMYDLVGFFIPGVAFAAVIAVNLRLFNVPLNAPSKVETIYILLAVIVSYILGRVLQGLTYIHMLLFEWVGIGLLGRTGPDTTPRSTSGSTEVTIANRVAKARFEDDPFFELAKSEIAEAYRVDTQALTDRTLENLAFSIAEKSAETALTFRFSADFEGGIATLAVVQLVLLGALAIHLHGFRTAWSLIPGIVAFWFAYGVGRVLVPEHRARFTCSGTWDWVRIRSLLPFATVFLAWILAVSCSGLRPPFWWAFPIVLLIWLTQLCRAFFYYDIGGRLVIYKAFSTIRRPPTPPGAKIASEQ